MAKTMFTTERKESFETKVKRILFNFFPAYRRTGGRVIFISSDWKEVHIRLGLGWTTKNYVGTVFGGSIFGALDPVYMIQLMNILGGDYIVWDKSAQIFFSKPIRKTVFARFIIEDELIDLIKLKVAADKKYTFDLAVSFQDKAGEVYASVIKTLYIADKQYSKTKKSENN